MKIGREKIGFEKHEEFHKIERGLFMRQLMRSFLPTLFLAVALDFIFVMTCFSQQDTASERTVKLILKDGSELIGTIVEEDSLSIIFKTLGNISMTIPREQVKALEHFSPGKYRTDPNHTRLLLAPTARSLRSGQGYFSTYEIFFPLVAVGVADFITLAGGMSLFPGVENQLFYLAPKVTPIQIDKFSLAGGVLYINATSGSSEGVGILYGVTSYGDPNTSLTFGLGWGFFGSEIADKPIILLGGELQTSNNTKLITENWFPPNSDISFLSFGIRVFGESLAADLGFIYPAGSEITGFPFFPWLGFAYNFGTAK
ncbi:MAG: hypothetical protein ACK44H_04100 [Candidatus Kryptonium sp.]